MHGATPDDDRDDTFAIQQAINRSKLGETIVFPTGIFLVGDSIDPRGQGRIFKGTTILEWDGEQVVAKTPTILRATGEKPVFSFHGEDLAFANLSFEGRAFFCDRPNNAMVKGVVFDNCWFSHKGMKGHGNSIEFTTGLSASRISHCVFDPISGDNGIYGYNWDNLVISNNHFKNGNEGIHLIAHHDPSKDLLIEQNYFSGLHRMAVEIQGGGVNTVVQDNYYERPVMTARAEENGDTFAYSIVSDRSKGTIVRRNTSIAPQRPDGIGVRIIFELGGRDVVCEENLSIGGNHVIAGNGGGATGVAKNNRISGFREGPRNSNGATIEYQNNDYNVALPWDINRGKPGPNKRIPTTRPAASQPAGR